MTDLKLMFRFMFEARNGTGTEKTISKKKRFSSLNWNPYSWIREIGTKTGNV